MSSRRLTKRDFETLRKRLQTELPRTLYEEYVHDLRYADGSAQEFVLTAPTGSMKDWIEGPTNAPILQVAEDLFDHPVSFKCEIRPESEDPTPSPRLASRKEPANLNDQYTFERYVIGDRNRFAYVSSLAVVKGLGTNYNPFFIWGAVGVGKTHLMQAIGHEVLREVGSASTSRPQVRYSTAENFINEWFDAIQEGRSATKDFQRRYRTVDLLLLDDVQFFEKKESMQEAFFYTFNELYQKKKQIVLTSDRPPKQLDRLEERLVNRFESGLTVPVEPPDLETRIAILKRRAKAHPVEIPDEILSLIAETVSANVRELEGTLTRVLAYSTLIDSPLTTSLVEEILKEFSPSTRQTRLDARLITEVVAEFFGLKAEDLKGKRQTRAVSRPRQIAMYLVHEFLGLTLMEIARLYSRKDHTTVLYALKKIQKEVDEARPTLEDVKLIKIKIKEMTR